VFCYSPVRGRFAIVFSDITELKQEDERLLEAQKLESLGLLAGGVAHDFNNLLVSVIGNASLAQDLLPSEHSAAELLDHVVKAGEQAAHLTRQMLAYAGKGQFLFEPVNLSELLPDISGLVLPSIPKKISLNFHLDDNLPLVQADRGQLQQVFMNLVLNAAEAIGSKAGLISVRTGLLDVDERFLRQHVQTLDLRRGKYVYLEVRDTGCGMDDATRAKIFDPFFSTKFTGRGLGLAAVGGIVRGHKGAIIVNSAPGKGSCFTILFPRVECAKMPSLVEGRGAAVAGTGTVLVVDDEHFVREMVKKSLERYGYKVLLADGGLAAIDVFKRHPGEISLVLLDLSMPELSGEDTLPELRRIRPDVKVVISSGYSESEAMRVFRGQRVSGFVQKPYTSWRLVEKIKSALG
jgi:nitrogen-specific signal transduction histidine kinase/CheY-like chemotaxis protein